MARARPSDANLRDDDRCACHAPLSRIEIDPVNRRACGQRRKHQAIVARGEAELRRKGRRQRDGFGRAARAAGGLVNRHTPDVHAAAAAAAEIQMASVRRPHGIPDKLAWLRRRAPGDGRGCAARRRHGVDRARRGIRSPVRNAVSARRPMRLHGVGRRNARARARRNIDDPYLTNRPGAVTGTRDRADSRVGGGFPVRRPGGVIADVRDALYRLTSNAHTENAAALVASVNPLRPTPPGPSSRRKPGGISVGASGCDRGARPGRQCQAAAHRPCFNAASTCSR